MEDETDKTVKEVYSTPAGIVEVCLPEDSPLITRHAFPAYEPAVTPLFAEYIDENTVLYDVGSRFGIYTLLAKELGVRKENLHTFEVNKKSHSILYDYAGEEIGHMNNVRVGSGYDTLSLDNYVYCNEYSPPTVMKMDIEGAELDALVGSQKILEEETPVLFIEVHPWRLRDNFNEHPDKIIEFLYSVGYNNIQICPDQRESGSRWIDIDEYDFIMGHNDNALFAEVKE